MTKYVSSVSLREYLGISRQRVHQIAAWENWRVKDYNRPYWFEYDQVQEYLLNREHSEIAREKYKKRFRGLIRHPEGYNKKCPVCKELQAELDKQIK